jgi:hypothetical protein
MAMDGPRAIPGIRCKSSTWKWWPGTESNHRHADFLTSGRGEAAMQVAGLDGVSQFEAIRRFLQRQLRG